MGETLIIPVLFCAALCIIDSVLSSTEANCRVMKARYCLLLGAFACSLIVSLQAVNSQMQDPDMVPPEVYLPVPGAPSQSIPANAGGVAAGMQMPPQGGRFQGMPGMQQNPAMQGAPGQYNQYQNPLAAAAQQQGAGIQLFVPAGWPFDGMPPPGGASTAMGMPGAAGAQYQTPQGMPGSPGGYPQGYGQPGLGSTSAQSAQGAANSGVPQASSGNGQVLPNDPAVSTNNADPNTAGPFSSDKECLMCKKKNGEGGVEGDGSSSGAAAGASGAGMASGINPSMASTIPPPAQLAGSVPGQSAAPNGATGATRPQLDPIAVIQTTKGPITIRLFKQYAPITVGNFVDLVQRGFYTNIRWHRVVPGFVIQAGCPKGDGTGGFVDPQSGKPRTIPIELHQRLRHNSPGVVAMARFGNDTNSASSQFYITLGPKQQLDNKYAVFGGVISGMDAVQRITANDRILGITMQ